MRKNIFTFISAVALLCSVSAVAQTNETWKDLSGNGHSMLIDANGHLWTCGSNNHAQLGDGKQTDDEYDINADKTVFEQIGTDTWKAVCALSFSSAAIQSDGSLWTWGENAYGQLGNPAVSSYASQKVPAKVGNAKWTKISGRTSTMMGIQEDGTLWICGDNEGGRAGIGSDEDKVDTPTQIGTDRWKDCATGYYHCVAVKDDGSLWSWGRNHYKSYNGEQYLIDNTDSAYYNTPQRVGEASDWVKVGAGVSSAAGLNSNGELFTWGFNDAGQLGRTTTDYKNATPTKILDGVKTFAVGDKHVLVIKNDGTLWGWGYNPHGELGNNDTKNVLEPIQIGTAKWVKVAAASYHSMGIQEDGSLWMWGWNRYGQLGFNDTKNRLVPTKLEMSIPDGINTMSSDKSLSINYVASDNIIKINSSNNISRVSIYNVNGSLVATKAVNGEKQTYLNVSVLPSQTYIVKVESNKGTSAKQFLK
jgi:alpha-tubulin suppressor-like RCC1 family protein